MAIYKLKSILFLWLCLALPCILAHRIKYCDKRGNYAVKVKGVDFKPDPVAPGKEAVFTISASTAKSISGGNVEIYVSYFGVHVHSETIDLCKETSCPISPGDFALSHKQTLPAFTPPGSYTLRMRMEDSNNGLLTCITFGFKIGFGASVADS